MVIINLEVLNELNSSEVRIIFDIVDKLFVLGVERIVILFQIIVVGDLFFGKLFVLEVIFYVYFFVKGGVCIQFVIELVLCLGICCFIVVIVCFVDGILFVCLLNIVDFNQEDIYGIIEDVKDKMGILGNISIFLKDVFCLEIEGFGMLFLMLVDLFGIFFVGIVKQLVEG